MTTEARQRPSEAANSFDQGFNISADRFSRHDAFATRFVICRCRDPLFFVVRAK